MDVAERSDLPATSDAEQLRARLAELEQHAARRVREMTALHEILLEINRPTDLSTLLNAIVKRAAGLLNASMGGLYLVRPSGDALELVVAYNMPGDFVGVVLQLGEGLSGRVAQTGQVITVSDYHAWTGRAAVYASVPFRRVIGVPLKVDELVIGVINVADDEKTDPFTEDEIRLVSLFADQAALVVVKTRLLETARHDLSDRYRTEQIQSSLYRISEAAHAAQNLDDLYRAIHHIIADLMPAHNFGIALHDAATDTILFPYFVDEDYQLAAPLPRPRGRGLVEYVLQTGEPLLGSAAELSALAARQDLQPVGAAAAYWLGVPLKWQGKTIGVVVVQTYQAGERLTEEHKQILTFVSTQVVMAIQRKRAEQVQASIYRISEAALAARSLDDLYPLIHQVVSELMPARNFYIALYDATTDTISFPYFVDEIETDKPVPARQHGCGLTEYVLHLGEPWLGTGAMIQDLIDQGQVGNVGPIAVDWLGVPLKADDQIIGLIAVQSYSEWVRLTDEHKGLLLFVSTQVALAIRRKQVDEARRESEQRYHALFDAARRQAQELTLLDRVRTAVTRELNLTALFRTVVTAIAETFGYTLVNLYMVEGQTLRLQHQVGYELVLTEIPLTSGVTGRVARTSQPALVEDVYTDPDFLAAMDDIVSEVCVPLVDADHTVGVLNIESTHGVRLTEADLQLMLALSQHISSAISRARLYTEARQNAARLTAAVESLPFDFWIMDHDGRYVLQNSICIQHWGNRIGQRPSQAAVPEQMLAHWELNNRRAFAGEIVQGEVTYEVDNEYRHFHEIIAPVWSDGEVQGILGVNVDITDRHQAEVALRASEARLRAVISNMPVVLFALDRDGVFTFVEGKGLEALGIKSDELMGRSAFEAVFASPRAAEALELALSGEALNVVLEIEEREFEMWVSPRSLQGGGFDGVIGVATDITERRRTEEMLRRAQKMESLGVLAGGIAHDFNNLLVAILGQTSLALLRLAPDSPARAPVEKSVVAAQRAADLTRQLLAYSGRGQFEHRPLDLNALIQENLHLFEVAVPKNVVLRSELAPALPLMVGDSGQLQQVIMNLLINAAEAIGNRTGEVVMRTTSCHLPADEMSQWQIGDDELKPGRYVMLEVRDNGCGMSPATLSRIFDPFFTTKFTGRGLGLAAVLGIVRGHKGGLRVSSEEMVGTTFDLVFPGGGISQSVAVSQPEVVQEVDMMPRLILVIDDEEPVRDAVTDILELEGLAVIAAPDGQTGIDLFRAQQNDVGLILLDLSMPGLNGEETFYELRQIDPQVQIVLSSGYSHDEVAPRFAGQARVGFIQKPYDAAMLVKEIKRQLTMANHKN